MARANLLALLREAKCLIERQRVDGGCAGRRTGTRKMDAEDCEGTALVMFRLCVHIAKRRTLVDIEGVIA